MTPTPTRTSQGATTVSTVVALLGLAMVAVGAWLWWSSGPANEESAPLGGAAADSPQALPPEPVVVEPAPGAPVRVEIPALGVRAPVLPVQPVGETLVPPRDPMELGWWADGAQPGADQGSALITGHTVQGGEGALNDLEALTRGQRIRVRTDSGVVGYRVTRTEVFTKGELSRHAERLFDQSVPGRLVLVTCEDWDGTQYLSNVVVTARPS